MGRRVPVTAREGGGGILRRVSVEPGPPDPGGIDQGRAPRVYTRGYAAEGVWPRDHQVPGPGERRARVNALTRAATGWVAVGVGPPAGHYARPSRQLWALKPAPKAVSHQSASNLGASVRRDSSKAKSTEGLLRLPWRCRIVRVGVKS